MDKIELTNSFDTSKSELIKKLAYRYSYVISFGQKPGVNQIYIELCANKNQDTMMTNFLYHDLESFLEKYQLEFFISHDAGSYLCNHVYYEGLSYIYQNQLSTKMIFIHVPTIDTDYDFDVLACVISNFIELLDISLV